MSTYHITYSAEAHLDGISKEAVREMSKTRDVGACDAVLIASILYNEDGSVSMMFLSRDGRTDDSLSPLEQWKVWLMLASNLAEDEQLQEGKRELCRTVIETVRQALGAQPKG